MPLGLTAEQLDAYCAQSYTLEGALETWTFRAGPFQWNAWQKNVHEFARRYSGRDPQAVCPEGTNPSSWALQVWKEESESVHGPEWRRLPLSKGAAVEAEEAQPRTPRRTLRSAERTGRSLPGSSGGES